MRVAIFSDTHLGFKAFGREQESFENAEQAFGIALDNKADVILIAGDIFNEVTPSTDVLVGAFQLFSKAKTSKKDIKIGVSSKKQVIEEIVAGIPIILIHGNHEFRGKDYTNVLHLYSKSGFAFYLHAETAVLEKGNEKLAVHALGGVPEQKALDALKLWNPKPVESAVNILLLHQNFKEFSPVEDEMVATLSLHDLPNGFDLIASGHLHWTVKQKLGKTTFLLAGSTICTQMKKVEQENRKGVHLFETQAKTIEFIPLPVQRNLFYHKISFEEAKPEQVIHKIHEAIEKDLKEGNALPPLIRLKLVGNLSKGISLSDIDLKAVEEKFRGKAIMSVSKEFSTTAFKKKIAELRQIQQSKQSISSIGLSILEKNLKETDFNDAFEVKRIFDLLAEDETDKVSEILSRRKK